MKKTVLTIAIMGLALFVTAQDSSQTNQNLVNKKGVPILPEAGEFSIGVDAAPFFQYIGNIFNGNLLNPAPGFGFTSAQPLRITGKYMVNANTAYRGIFRLGFGNDKITENSIEDGQTDLSVTVEDTYKSSQLNIGLGAGLEKRRGKGRLQGIYGAQAIFTVLSGKDTYEYGNAFSTTNVNPTRTDFGTNVNGNTFLLEEKSKLSFGVDLQAFVGVEFFFAPKFSLSGEFTYGVSYLNTGATDSKFETWDAGNGTILPLDINGGSGSSFGLDTGIGATLNLNFYF